MTALACIALILCVIFLMMGQGVGPFTNEPWLKLHLWFRKLGSYTKLGINLLSILVALFCSAILVGFIK